ncbi:hypothetical protein LEN26_014580 [Aphanomyces euteiches]|nr:hypothetical protein LEN26_014580 [Aphanomyces euteiches]KAH9125370.1 hypothetical protein AeMF1_004007 [Aphanomyces euteiches]
MDRSKETLEKSKAEFERIKEAPPMPQLHSVPEVEGRTQFEVYDELMREWEENEVRRRVDIEELTETIAQMEHRLAKTTLDRMRDDIAFLQEILKCEIERGAGLWSKKREYEVWRTKMMLDRVDRDEQLVQLRFNGFDDSQGRSCLYFGGKSQVLSKEPFKECFLVLQSSIEYRA